MGHPPSEGDGTHPLNIHHYVTANRQRQHPQHSGCPRPPLFPCSVGTAQTQYSFSVWRRSHHEPHARSEVACAAAHVQHARAGPEHRLQHLQTVRVHVRGGHGDTKPYAVRIVAVRLRDVARPETSGK